MSRQWTPDTRSRLDVLHRHARAPRVVYAGFSQTAPEYHLFRCVATSEPPRNRHVALKPFDRRRFTSDSKAGQGGCSMRGCLGDAEEMNEEETDAYCGRCAGRVRGLIPCHWTTITPCTRRLGLEAWPYGKPCPTCVPFKEMTR